MQVQLKAGKTLLFPNFIRDVNSKTKKHIKRFKEYRKYFEKAIRGFYHKKDYQDFSYISFLKLYCALAPVRENFQIFNEITNDSLQFAGETRAKGHQKLKELKGEKQDDDTIILIRNLERQICRIESMEEFLLYLREDSQIDYETVVQVYLRKLYSINEKNGRDYFAVSQQRQVFKVIKEFRETNERMRQQTINQVLLDRSRRQNRIRGETVITSMMQYNENSLFDIAK